MGKLRIVSKLEEDFIELNNGELFPLLFFSEPNADNLYSTSSCEENLYNAVLDIECKKLPKNILFHVGGMNYSEYPYCEYISLSKKNDNTILFLVWLSYDIHEWNKDINLMVFQEVFSDACIGEKFIAEDDYTFYYDGYFLADHEGENEFDYEDGRLYLTILVESDFESHSKIDSIISNILKSLNKTHNEIVDQNKNFKKIIRESFIPKEYQSSAISLLHHFRNIIDDLHPNIDISLSVENLHDRVKIIINCPVADEDTVVKLFEDYGLVITGEKKPDELLSNSHELMILEHKLDMARMELKHSQQRLEFERRQYDSRIIHLEKSSDHYSSLLGDMIFQNKVIREDFNNLARDTNISNDGRIESLMNLLADNLESRDEDKVTELLTSIKEEDVTLFDHISDIIIKGSLSGASGNFLYQWILPIISAIPK